MSGKQDLLCLLYYTATGIYVFFFMNNDVYSFYATFWNDLYRDNLVAIFAYSSYFEKFTT